MSSPWFSCVTVRSRGGHRSVMDWRQCLAAMGQVQSNIARSKLLHERMYMEVWGHRYTAVSVPQLKLYLM